MEAIYDPSRIPSTGPIDYKTLFKTYASKCNIIESFCQDKVEEVKEILSKDFNLPLDRDDIEELNNLCTIDKLKVKDENPKLPLPHPPRKQEIDETHPITPKARMLNTVQTKEECLLLKMKKRSHVVRNKLTENITLVNDITPGSTFIHKIVVFRPMSTVKEHLRSRLTPDHIRKQYEIEVLGTNTLLQLANSIKCISDSYIMKEVPDLYADLTTIENAKDKYPSRCFFIDGVFYNDLTSPAATDYSAVVKKWATENNIGNFTSKSMENVTFNSLQPRLGYGYVYIHQGNCEHLLSFSDARLIQRRDSLDSSSYPRIYDLTYPVNHLCLICSENQATWLVANSDRLHVRKAFFCDKCCESYMFLDGKKIGEFQLFPLYIGIASAKGDTGLDQDSYGNNFG